LKNNLKLLKSLGPQMRKMALAKASGFGYLAPSQEFEPDIAGWRKYHGSSKAKNHPIQAGHAPRP
jgi:hypothetical protein